MNSAGKLLTICIAGCLVLVFGSRSVVAGDNASDLLSRLQKKYTSVQDVSVEFKQHTLFGVSKTENHSSGTIYIKKGNKYRIEFNDRLIVTDGASVWNYSKANKQVIVNIYKEDPKSFSPDKVLLNIPENYHPAIVGNEKIGNVSTSILQLTPKMKRSNIKWMKIWVDNDDTMRKIVLFDVSENTMTYELSRVRFNPGSNDSMFTYQAPPDVEVVDLR